MNVFIDERSKVKALFLDEMKMVRFEVVQQPKQRQCILLDEEVVIGSSSYYFDDDSNLNFVLRDELPREKRD